MKEGAEHFGLWRVERNEVSVPFHPQPSPSIGLDIFQPSQGHEGPLSFCPLDDNEVPRAGDLVALDAEFVTLTPEEKSSGRNGRLITVKAAVRLVGRVTCVRGWGPRRGVPFIDDHISCEEEISDYVSKYSGIFPGDLDPTQSSHHFLKRTYKKVRHLVDVGCIFVGHGLKNDFDMLGIVVPSDQVVDTVHLFHLPYGGCCPSSSWRGIFWTSTSKRVPQFQRSESRSYWIWRPKER
ncbi:hypothetical protein TCAL_14520 [Tigriopus californicus]|uniref:Exonuclease domain-containing protein n=1 Tax=Tigriopus californicus TaxID=6832 RepID=A0A553PRS7_TIGCA|nr:hypothetical protein TCAL_14520 [Tigriopus californicus]